MRGGPQGALVHPDEFAIASPGPSESTAPVLTLITQFDGGKTHALTALYHLTRDGSAAGQYPGMSGLLQEARSRLFQAAGGAVLILFDTVAMTGTTQGAAVISRSCNQGEMLPDECSLQLQ